MLTIRQTDEFEVWLDGLKDRKARARIIARIRGMSHGSFGDHAPVGEGVYELRIFIGPGYRVYYMREGEIVYLILNGGNKDSQTRDIAKAHKIAKLVKDQT